MTLESAGTMPAVPGDVAYPLRLPPELKDRLTEWAKAERRSLNAHIVFLLEAAVDQHEQAIHAKRRAPKKGDQP